MTSALWPRNISDDQGVVQYTTPWWWLVNSENKPCLPTTVRKLLPTDPKKIISIPRACHVRSTKSPSSYMYCAWTLFFRSWAPRRGAACITYACTHAMCQDPENNDVTCLEHASGTRSCIRLRTGSEHSKCMTVVHSLYMYFVTSLASKHVIMTNLDVALCIWIMMRVCAWSDSCMMTSQWCHASTSWTRGTPVASAR